MSDEAKLKSMKYLEKMAYEHNKTMLSIGDVMVEMNKNLTWIALGVKIGLVMLGVSIVLMIGMAGA